MRRLLAFREFRLLWLAQSLSVIGDNIVLVALALFIIDSTGARPTSASCSPRMRSRSWCSC